MAIASRTASVYIIDCSKSMGILQSFTEGTGENVRTYQVTPLEIMLKYVKVKIAERLIRGLKTTPVAIILYATSKTKNIITTLSKNDPSHSYDRENDPYRGIQELISFTFEVDASMIKKLDEVQSGRGLDVTADKNDAADLLNAILVGVETLDQQPKVKNYLEREVVILTDGESFTNWNDMEAAAQDMMQRKISLTVIGMGFNHEDEIATEKKSEIKIQNEEKLREMVGFIDESVPSLYATAFEAMVALTAPKIREVRPTNLQTKLTIGDVLKKPTRFIAMHIDVKKAIMVAPLKSMKTMSLRNFDPAGKQSTQRATQTVKSESQGFANGSQFDNGASTSQLPAFQTQTQTQTQGSNAPTDGRQSDFSRAFDMGDIGVHLEDYLFRAGIVPRDIPGIDADLRTNDVKRETQYFYRKVAAAKEFTLEAENKKAREDQEEGEDAEDTRKRGPDKSVGGNISIEKGYYYGGTLVSLDDIPPGAERLSGLVTGMEILAFLKKADIPYEWRMGDLLDVTASPGQTGSQLMLSALINGMQERKSVAIVRWTGKAITSNMVLRTPDPKIGILWPALHIPGHEFCYWAQMPFSEDLRKLSFPSLTEIKLRKNIVDKNHKFLPTEEMNVAMSAFVDAMDISQEGEPDEQGNPTSWYSPEKSFSPAIHNLNNTLIARLISRGPLPPIPEALTRYANPPATVLERASEARSKLITTFNIHKVPPKPKKIAKNGESNYRTVENELPADTIDPNLGGAKFPTPSLKKNSAIDVVGGDSDDDADSRNEEDDDDNDDEEMKIVETVKKVNQGGYLKTSELEEFKKRSELSSSDAIKGMFKSVKGWVTNSFSTNNYPKAIEGIDLAASLAEKTGASGTFNVKLRECVVFLKNTSHKAFCEYLREADITLLAGADASKEDILAFTKLLSL